MKAARSAPHPCVQRAASLPGEPARSSRPATRPARTIRVWCPARAALGRDEQTFISCSAGPAGWLPAKSRCLDPFDLDPAARHPVGTETSSTVRPRYAGEAVPVYPAKSVPCRVPAGVRARGWRRSAGVAERPAWSLGLGRGVLPRKPGE